MNCDTGHLVNREMLDKFSKAERKRYSQVPDELDEAAKAELLGRSETMVNLSEKSPLTDWANRTRNQRKRDRKRRK